MSWLICSVLPPIHSANSYLLFQTQLSENLNKNSNAHQVILVWGRRNLTFWNELGLCWSKVGQADPIDNERMIATPTWVLLCKELNTGHASVPHSHLQSHLLYAVFCWRYQSSLPLHWFIVHEEIPKKCFVLAYMYIVPTHIKTSVSFVLTLNIVPTHILSLNSSRM